MGTMTYQITGLTSVYSTDYSGADQRKHQSSASLARVRRIHRWTVNSPHKGPVTRKIFPFDDVIMICFNWNCGNSTHQYVLLDIISCYRTTCISSQTVKIWIKRSISTRRHFQKNSWKDDVYILFQISLKFVRFAQKIMQLSCRVESYLIAILHKSNEARTFFRSSETCWIEVFS